MKKFLISMFILSTLALMGCTISNTRPHIDKVNVSASDAPEVHGLNTNGNPHSAMLRVNGKIGYSKQKDENVKPSGSYKLWYEMGGVDVAGKMDALYKIDHFVIGGGFGIDDGIFYHFTSGWNFSHFELGAFLGIFNQLYNVQYSGKKCEATKTRDISLDGLVLGSEEYCTSYTPFEEDKYKFGFDPFLGVFAGTFIDKFFVNYSLSFYTSYLKIESKSLDMPLVISHYFNLGYRFNKKFDFSIGTVLTKADSKKSEWVYGINAGVSYFLL